MSQKYAVVKTENFTYLDASGQAVQGYRVMVDLKDFAETHAVFARSLDPKTVQGEIEKVLAQREALAKL